MLDTWRKLYSIADQIHTLAPWRWLDGHLLYGVFGVEDPITKEIGFMYIMGQMGEHFGISRYPGAEGLQILKTLGNADSDNAQEAAETVLGSSQLQLSWEDPVELDKIDKQWLKKLGLKYRGRSAYPLFRSYEPYLYPWFITEEQARVLIIALEQSLLVYQRLQNDSSIMNGLKDNSFLVRVQKDGEWKDDIKEMPPVIEKVAFVSQIPSLPLLKKLPRKGSFDLDLILSPPVKSKDLGDRPFFPYFLMILNPKTGIVLAAEFLNPHPSVEQMYGTIAEKVCSALMKIKTVPEEIRVRRQVLAGILSPLGDELGLKITQSKRLPALEQIAQRIMSGVGGG